MASQAHGKGKLFETVCWNSKVQSNVQPAQTRALAAKRSLDHFHIARWAGRTLLLSKLCGLKTSGPSWRSCGVWFEEKLLLTARNVVAAAVVERIKAAAKKPRLCEALQRRLAESEAPSATAPSKVRAALSCQKNGVPAECSQDVGYRYQKLKFVSSPVIPLSTSPRRNVVSAATCTSMTVWMCHAMFSADSCLSPRYRN